MKPSQKLIAKKGAKVVLGARGTDKLKQLADTIQAEVGQAVFRELDVAKETDNTTIATLLKKPSEGLTPSFECRDYAKLSTFCLKMASDG